MNKLIIEDDEGKTTIVPLIRDEITIGRKEGNTIRLTERNVSRRHAKLVKNNGVILLEDLGSYNGITLNGTPVKEPVQVKEGDRIQIGDYVLALKVDSRQAAATDPFEEMKTIPMEKEEVEANIAEQEAAARAEDSVETVKEKLPAGLNASAAQAPAPATAAEPVEAGAPEQKPDLVDEYQPASAHKPAARLVMVTEPSRGVEFSLESEASVVGRWPENSIVVDHQSISRHHAKIIRDDNRYTIVDMGSQNGVLVNGEKYDRVELRKGDMIDLGHVRFRFIAPGEDFDFYRDFESEQRKSRFGLYAAIGILGAVGVAAAVFLFRPGEDKETPEKKDEIAAVEKVDKETEEEPETVTPQISSADHSKINAAIDAKDWEKAVSEGEALLKIHGDDALAKELIQKAKNEKENEIRFNNFMKSWKRGDHLAAVKLGKGFPQDSVYYKEIAVLHPQALEKYTTPLLNKANALLRRKRCSELNELSRSVTDLNPSETRFQALVDSCAPKETAVAEVSPRTSPREKTSPGTRTPEPKKETRPRPVETPSENVDQLIQDARDSWARNDCARALTVARKAYQLQPSTLLVYIIGSCACRTKRPKTAKWAYDRLSGGRQRLVVKACAENNITLP